MEEIEAESVAYIGVRSGLVKLDVTELIKKSERNRINWYDRVNVAKWTRKGAPLLTSLRKQQCCLQVRRAKKETLCFA